jgi:phosphoribosylaminoimidazolecarboxamide formyltransferase/IMP cyclohydrolase
MIEVRRAIVSVADKEGILEFARGLVSLGIEIRASDGTAKYLAENGVKAGTISEYTGQREVLGGRVKTLHPKIFASILATKQQEPELRGLGWDATDMVAVNLYPFEDTISRQGATFEEAMENIDIGGVSLIRAAAKNADRVAVLVDKDQYTPIIEEMKRTGGKLGDVTLRKLAIAAFEYTSGYDTAIFNYLWRTRGDTIPPALRLAYPMGSGLRYGENPYQKAAFYRDSRAPRLTIASCELLFGKPLSFNNIVDLDAALRAASEFEETSAVIIKHTNPCGFALGSTLREAYLAARESDKISAYGCVVGLNRAVDLETAKAMKPHFVEGIIAPDYAEDALALLKTKKDIRLMRTGEPFRQIKELQMMKVSGGMLVQTSDFPEIRPEEFKLVTEAKPSEEQIRDMVFGIKVSRHVKSNSIVLAKRLKTVGIGAGQMSRVDACHLAAYKAGPRAMGSVLASDAFFPFRDGLDTAAEAGVAAIVQPGGSIRDAEVIVAADEHGISMMFCGIRTFKH